MSRTLNLLESLPDATNGELFEPLLRREGLLVERIVSRGQSTPEGEWYNQGWDEWVLILCGNAEIQIEGDEEPAPLVPGDSMLLPAGCRHRVVSTASDCETVWLAIHYGKLPKP